MNELLIRIISFSLGYLFGLFQTAYIYGRLRGIDIRTRGSGNAGSTNALRVFGKKAGITVFAFDCAKAIIAISIVRFLIVPIIPKMGYLLLLYAATGVIIGHNFPFYMSFRGGKGIAATAGMIVALHPVLYIPSILGFVIPFLITNYVSFGSLCLYVAFVIEIFILGIYNPFGILDGMETSYIYEMYILAAFLMILAFIRHKDNIKRLINGNENKTYLSKNKAKMEDKNGNL